jgi:hypothetical protein
MHQKRPRTLVTSIALAALAAQAQAVGFGSGPTSAVLGLPLNQRIAIRLDPGERLDPECVSAEVQVGDTRLPVDSVRARLEGDGNALAVRVTTTAVVDEPVVTLAVSLGCPPRLSRRFVLFADPSPASAPSAPIAAPVAEPPAEPEKQATPPRPAAEPRPAAPAPAPASTQAPEAQGSVAKSSAPRPSKPAVRRAPAAESAAPVVAAARPRLRLDAPEPAPANPLLAVEVIQAAASAAAADAVAQATAAAASRVATMEQSIERLRAESAADREALKQLRQKAADQSQAAGWVPYLAGLVALLALLAAWLGLKLRRLQAERRQTWWNAAAAQPEAAAVSAPGAVPTEAHTESGLPTGAAPAAVSGGQGSTRSGTLGPVFMPEPVEPISEPPPPMERTEPLPVGWREESEPQRDVSIEELIDLEQQAEFFIVLGQEEAAIDLLVDHLRSTGGGSPLPYLKLLEIYRRRGDREAYDRTRARFNHRFNAYAPDWDTDSHEGRALEDYPSIVARLQMAWPSPIDAMAELESLLFRKARGELFDMPAYRDVLFLYSLARDLLDREPQGAPSVDVLLPINEGLEFTQPMSFDDILRPGDSGMVPLDNPPTVPVDLDVTQPVMPDSLFGENATDPGLGGGRRRR